MPNSDSPQPEPRQREQRSLFGEILDWMLAPLLLLWPMSVVLTWLVAQGIANKPFDRELGEMVRALSKEVAVRKALGARRRSLVGQFLTETMLLSFLAFLPAMALLFVLINMVVDLLYFAVDPRLRAQR